MEITKHNPRWALCRSHAILACAILALCLGGCVNMHDPEASQIHVGDLVAKLGPGQTVGQTVVSRRSRLNGVELWVRQAGSPTDAGTMTVELYHATDETQLLVTIPITYGVMARTYPISVPIPPQDDPPGQGYTLKLRTDGGPLEIYGRGEDAYASGQMVVDGQGQPADVGFRLSYDYGLAAAAGDLWMWLSKAWLILPLALVLWLPGRLLLGLVEEPLNRRKLQIEINHRDTETTEKTNQGNPELDQDLNWDLDWGERSALSAGLSLAVIPLALLWTSAIGLHWTRNGLMVVSAILAALYVLYLCRRKKQSRAARMILPKKMPWAAGLALLAVFLFSLGLRLAMVRDLAAPAWVDSVHHALITRLILEQGALPDSYAPYVELDTAGYHPGFHASLAAFLGLASLDLADGMLVWGQVLNALCVLAVYLLATTLTGSWFAGAAAGLITGAVTLMPAYYASWGRYTQLAGLLILPVCIALLKRLIEGNRANLPLLAVSSVACAGLFLAHYRVIAFLLCFLLAFLVGWGLQSLARGAFTAKMGRALLLCTAAGGLAILLCLPWWPVFMQSMVTPYLEGIRGVVKPLGDFTWGYLLPAHGRQVLILAGLGLALSIVRLRWFGPVIALWVGLMFLLANQGALGLPGQGFVNNTSVEIMLFMPLSVLAGYLIGDVAEFGQRLVPGRWKALYLTVWALVGTWIALVGGRDLLPILNSVTLLARQADRPALAWVQDTIPPGETVLINPFLWGYGLYGGQDGGFWLSPGAGLASLPPPVLYGTGDPETVRQINEVCRQVMEKGKDAQALHGILQSKGIRYIFIGARGGVISPKALQESPLFEQLYAQDGAWVFKAR